MSSALKPALPAGTAAASPGKPSGGAPALVGQNLTHHQPSAAHAAQSLAHIPMSPVSQNMAQMAQNMSHHGNLSHVGQNNGAPAIGASNGAPQPSKVAAGAPLSLVHDKGPAGASQPLALTRPTDKKDDAEVGPIQSNGVVEPSKPLAADQPQPEPEKPKPEASALPVKIGEKTPTKSAESPAKPIENSPAKPVERSPAKPIEKATVAPTVPPKIEVKLTPENLLQVNKLGSSTEPTEKSSLPKPKDVKDTAPIPVTIPPAISAPAVSAPAVSAPAVSAPAVSAPAVSAPAMSAPAVPAPTAEPKVPDESASAKTITTPEKSESPKPESKPTEPEVKTPAKMVVTTEKKEVVTEADKPTEVKTHQLGETIPSESKTPLKKDQTLPPKKEEQASLMKKEVPDKDPIKQVPAKEVRPKDAPKKEAPKTQPLTNTPTQPVKKAEISTPAPKSTLKLATVTPTSRKRRQESKSPAKTPADGPSTAKKVAEGDTPATPDSRQKRNRTKVQPYQSPTPELAMATKLSASAGRATPTKPGDDKLIVFYKNEYLAVRNAEGGFYVCQAVQNVYRSSRKIKIRWLSQDKSLDPTGGTYKPDFYDVTDMECVLTTLSMSRASGGAQVLSGAEASRARSILERALSAEQGGRAANLQLTEEHPDGLDLSLYKDESQLEKKKGSNKRKSSLDKSSSDQESSPKEDNAKPSPTKRAKPTPRKSPKSAQKVAKSSPKTPNNNNKRKPATGSVTPIVANKTALATATKASPAKTPAKKAKQTPVKKSPAPVKTVTPAKPAPPAKTAAPAKPPTPAKPEPTVKTPTQRGKTPKKSDKELKIAALAATPSTSTGKATRTPRKPPSKKRRSSANNFILR